MHSRDGRCSRRWPRPLGAAAAGASHTRWRGNGHRRGRMQHARHGSRMRRPACRAFRPCRLRARRRRRQRGQRLRPEPDRARLRLAAHVASCADGRTLREWNARRGRQGDRDRARRAATPPGRSTAASPGRRCAAARATGCASVHERQRAPAHGALPRHPPLVDGRRAGPRRGHRRRAHPARPVVHLRVRRRAVRPPPLPLPRLAARGAHREGPLRHVHRRSQGAARRGRRARDGHERVRHELRLRQRGLRRQHGRASTTSTARSR